MALASGPRGDLLAWKYDDFIASKGISAPAGASDAVAAPAGAFGAEQNLPASYANGPLVDLGAGHVARLIFLPHGPHMNTPEVATGLTNGHFAAPQKVKASVLAYRASLAGNARGKLMLA